MPASTNSCNDSAERCLRGPERDDVRWHPERATAEDGSAVQREGERTVLPLHLDRAESHVAQVDLDVMDAQTQRVQRLVAVRVGPPAGNVGNPDRCRDDVSGAVIDDGDLLAVLPHPQFGPGGSTDTLEPDA